MLMNGFSRMVYLGTKAHLFFLTAHHALKGVAIE
jgi:hypothetical protein